MAVAEAGPDTEESETQEASETPEKKHGLLIPGIISLLVLGLIGGSIYYFYFRSDEPVAKEPAANEAMEAPAVMEDEVMEDEVMEDEVMEDEVMEPPVMEEGGMEEAATETGPKLPKLPTAS